MFLCPVCDPANSFPKGECHICKGSAERYLQLVQGIAPELKSMKGVGSFCISTIIPKEWLINEEEAWDRKMTPDSESIKNILNRRIVKALKDATGLRYDSANGDCRATFDFSSEPKALVERMPLFIFGRYKKHVTGLSQSRWLCATCVGKGCPSCGGKGKNYESVEERIGDPAKSAIGAHGYVMHASGREDVDATNSAGRAFVLEVKEPGIRTPDLDALAREIGKSGEVSVVDLRTVRRADVELITESHFDKTYEAGVDFGRAVDVMDDGDKIRSLEGRTILQQTPARVAHRRADLIRHRKIKHIEPVNLAGGKGSLIIKAEAGTYIKELISSDNGRTKPSVAQAVGTSAVCTRLAVIEIDDGFLDFCLKNRTD